MSGKCVSEHNAVSWCVNKAFNTRWTQNWRNTNILGWKRGAVHEEDTDEDVNLETQRDLRAFGDKGSMLGSMRRKENLQSSSYVRVKLQKMYGHISNSQFGRWMHEWFFTPLCEPQQVFQVGLLNHPCMFVDVSAPQRCDCAPARPSWLRTLVFALRRSSSNIQRFFLNWSRVKISIKSASDTIWSLLMVVLSPESTAFQHKSVCL